MSNKSYSKPLKDGIFDACLIFTLAQSENWKQIIQKA